MQTTLPLFVLQKKQGSMMSGVNGYRIITKLSIYHIKHDVIGPKSSDHFCLTNAEESFINGPLPHCKSRDQYSRTRKSLRAAQGTKSKT